MSAAAPSVVTVHVLLFASYAETFGTEKLHVTLPSPAAVSDVVDHLRSMPGGERLPPKPLCALNFREVRIAAHPNQASVLDALG